MADGTRHAARCTVCGEDRFAPAHGTHRPAYGRGARPAPRPSPEMVAEEHGSDDRSAPMSPLPARTDPDDYPPVLLCLLFIVALVAAVAQMFD